MRTFILLTNRTRMHTQKRMGLDSLQRELAENGTSIPQGEVKGAETSAQEEGGDDLGFDRAARMK